MRKILFTLMIVFMMSSVESIGQMTKSQVTAFVTNSIAGDNIDDVNIYMEPNIQTNAYYVLSPYDSIAVPYSNYWMFFIDEQPEYLWGHRCSYVFVNSINDNYTSVEKQLPPFLYNSFMEEVSIAVDIDKEMPDGYGNSDYIPTPNSDVNGGKYAVLFCGADNVDPTFMWNALSHSYCSLIEHGYPKDNIYVLSCNGSDIGAGSNPSMDLDNDNQSDILPVECNANNLNEIFDTLADKMTDSDILYIFACTHGTENDTLKEGNVSFVLWNNEKLYDSTFASMIEPIKCSQMIINIFSCFSGGFTDDLINMNNSSKKTLLTATDGINGYWRFLPELKMDVYNYLICSALRGGYPDILAPWYSPYRIGENPLFFSIFDEEDINYDLSENGGNNNGLQEINEVIRFGSKYDNQFRNKGSKVYNCGFLEDLLSLRGVTGKVTNTQTVNGSFHIEDELNIEPSVSLTLSDGTFYLFDADIVIKPSANLNMGNNTSIIAKNGNCTIFINGNMTLGNNVTFEAEENATLTIIFADNDLNINNATFTNCELVFPQKSISFTSCNFNSTPIDLDIADIRYTGQSVTIDSCHFTPGNKVLNSAINISGYGTYSVSNSIIKKINSNTGYFRNGIMIYYCGKNSSSIVKDVTHNTVRNCQQTGLIMYNSTGNITMNEITQNGTGVKLLNNSTIMHFSGNSAATLPTQTQNIHDNDSYEVYMTRNCKPQYFHYNAISDDGSTAFIYYDPYIAFANINEQLMRGTDTVDVTYNWWNNADNAFIASHLTAASMLIMPDTVPAVVYDFIPIWQMNNGSYESTADELLLAAADSLSSVGNYSAAKTIYMDVVENYPYTTSAETSLKTLLSIESNTGNDFVSLKNYYLTNSTITSNLSLSVLSSSLANKCNEILENYKDAISWYESVIMDTTTTFNDSIFATIDLGNLYLKIEEQGNKGVCGKLSQFIPLSNEAYQKQTDYAISLIPKMTESQFKPDELYAQNPVTNMQATVNEDNSVLVSWNYPDGYVPKDRETLSWSGEPINATGYYSISVDVAHRYEASDLTEYIGWRLRSITIYPRDAEYQYTVKAWIGDTNNLQQLYSEDIIAPVLMENNTVVLGSDVYIEDNKELWVGCHIMPTGQYPGDYPIACDLGPAIPWKGDLFKLDGNNKWDSFSQTIGLQTNFFIIATIESPEGKTVELSGYKVYADDELIGSVNDPQTLQYVDDRFVKRDVEYCVTAAYGEEESTAECAVVEILSVSENMKNSNVKVFPNPADNMLAIKGVDVSKIMVYNKLGQLIEIFYNTDELKVTSYPADLYLMKIISAEGKEYTVKFAVK